MVTSATLGHDANLIAEGKSLAFSLLGPPKMEYKGQPLSIVRRQGRALLYRLGALLEPVSREELLATFWPEEDDTTARRNLTRLVSLVREGLPEPDAIKVTSTEVSLDPSRVWSDASVFTKLSRRETVSAWEQAVTLYSGSFLAGFYLHQNAEYDQWQTCMVEQMRLRCLDALMKLIDYNTACGEYPTAIKFARRYLEIDDVAETVHRRLIQLYGRLGQRELVQQQFELCTIILERELGVEPLPETLAEYNLALKGYGGGCTLHMPKPTTAMASQVTLPFVGREQVMRQLERAYKRLKDGGVILVRGETGVGKSRLMEEFAADRNAVVLKGRCHNGMSQFAYHPIVEALRPMVQSPQFRERGISPVWLSEVERIMPELCTSMPDLPAPMEVDATRMQSRLFEGIVQLLMGLAIRINVVLCLDDLHWADASTLLWLHYLATRLQGSGICVCATYSTEESENVMKLRRGLQRSGAVTEIELEALSVEAIVALIQTVQGRTDHDSLMAQTDMAQRLHAATGGNAFFVLELIYEMAEQGGFEQLPARLPVPKTVQATIGHRVARLSANARQVLETAAVLDPQLEFRILHLTSGRDELEVVEGVSELIRHHLIRDADGGLEFQHELVKQTVYEGLPVWRRRLLHQRAAETLMHRCPANAAPAQALIAGHYAAANGELLKASVRPTV